MRTKPLLRIPPAMPMEDFMIEVESKTINESSTRNTNDVVVLNWDELDKKNA